MNGGRVILYHQQATSARTLFLRLSSGSVCAFDPVPTLAVVIEDQEIPAESGRVHAHPASLLRQASEWLELEPDQVRVNCDFRAVLDVPGDNIDVWLVRVTTTDPPYEKAAAVGASFVPLTSLRQVSPAELALLGRAYKAILG